MPINEKDAQILQHIVNYCQQITLTVDFWGNEPRSFLTNFIYQNAIAMPLLQVGELSHHLSQEFTNAHKNIPWRAIIDMRNYFAHGYNLMDPTMIWHTATADVPVLATFCQTILRENHFPVPRAKSPFLAEISHKE